MVTLPSASTSVSASAGAGGSGLDLICILAPVRLNADYVPRLFGKASDILAQHDYSEGLEYASFHLKETGKSVLFCGLPIVTVGAVGRFNSTGNTGTSVVSVAAGADGVLGEHEGRVEIVRGGIVGTDQITFDLYLDGTITPKRVRLGTATSYVIPYVGVTISFAAGTLVAGDVALTWFGSAPRVDASGLTAAFTALGAQFKAFRSVLLCGGDFQTSGAAQAFLDELEGYESEHERFVYGRASTRDRLPYAAMSRISARMTGSPTLTFAEVGGTGDTITRSGGSWITDGFAVGDTITVAGSVSNNVTGPIASLSATVITLGTTDLAAEGPVSNCTVTGTPTITFAEVGGTGDTITRNRGSWLDDGFRVGDALTVAGSASNNITPLTSGGATIASLSATVITLGSTDLAAEVIGSTSITLTAGETKAAWAAANEAAFAGVNSANGRLDLSLGRARKNSPFSGYSFRRPAAWGASLREYANKDIHVATWRKSDGPTGWDLFDASGTLVEWDDRVDGAAATAARFTSYRTWGNGPQGAFIAQSLTRADEGSLLSRTHNAAVVNEACRVNQIATENVVGRSLVLNDDGTASKESLGQIRDEVNAELALSLLQNRGEGPRASAAFWEPSTTDILNVAEAELTGTLTLNLLGTIHKVSTSVRVRSGGQ